MVYPRRRGVPGYIPPYVLPGYIPPCIPPYTPWVYHHATTGTGVPVPTDLSVMLPDDEALGSKREYILGRRLS